MIRQELLSPVPGTDDHSQFRLRFIQALAIFFIVGTLLWLLTSVALFTMGEPPNAMTLALAVGFILLNGGLLMLVRRRQIGLASLGLVITFILVSIAADRAFLLAAVMAIIAAAVLLERFMFILAMAIVLGEELLYLAQSVQRGSDLFTPEVSNRALLLAVLVIVGAATRYLAQMTERAGNDAQHSAGLLRATAEIGQSIASMLDVDELLRHTVGLIQERLGFYHVQIFLVDEEEKQAVLKASTGIVGRQLLARGHQLGVGSRSVIGRVTHTGKPVLVRDTDPIHARNELLPDTRAELAIPLMDGDKVIGALDVQSKTPDAFQAIDIQALQTIGNLLAAAIRNARLFEAQTRSLEENKRLFLEAEANLREIQRLNQQLTKLGWTEHLEKHHPVSGITLQNDEIVPSADWSESLIQASQQRRPVSIVKDDGRVVAVPVTLRGEVIGAIEVEADDDMPESDAIEMVQAVAQRLAISLDNVRLFEEAQEVAAREQRISEIISRYQSVTTVDELLRVTLTELSESLGARRSAIRLGAVRPANQNGEESHD